ncbi:glycosyltransferase family 2 protein [Curtobacterium sp. UCD-KPL2560]|uniref:glycosyltransferase n=1 Tax=Curtobacterium sp. UCD-KPL2560 TaxID=1885315 RepID=UPI000A786D73|nr:glycosyltransferase family 2 protein [Curtobacterium sp. UCD-KPL2560]
MTGRTAVAVPARTDPVWPRRVDVVVPVHDEEAAVGRCLSALADAVRAVRAASPGVRVGVTLVLDGCTDGTAAVVAAARSSDATWDDRTLHVLASAHVGVGRARALGVAHARVLGAGRTPLPTAATDPVAPAGHWFAHTDADSRVDPDWLRQHLAALTDGAHVLVGAVVPDADDLDADVLARWRAAHPPGATLGHVHGANLGVRADVDTAVGGFDPVPEHEDVRLVARARALGFRVRDTEDLPVVTSGRFAGRTPGGYAEHLRRTYGDAG